MKNTDDIANLLKQFGGRPEDYFEVTRSVEARDSQARWPLLASLGDAGPGQQTPAAVPHSTPESAAPRQDPPPVRLEPQLGPIAPAFPAPAAPVPPVASDAKPAPKAQFIPPRPRGHLGASRTPADRVADAVRASLQNAPAQPQPSAPAPSTPLAAFATVTAPAASQHASTENTPLQQLFDRLARPASADQPRDRGASLLQRLSKL